MTVTNEEILLALRDVATSLTSNEAIAGRLEAARETLNISKSELATRCGISMSTYSNYLSFEQQPQIDTGRKLARGLGITLDWIYSGSLSGLNDRMRAALSQHPYAAP